MKGKKTSKRKHKCGVKRDGSRAGEPVAVEMRQGADEQARERKRKKLLKLASKLQKEAGGSGKHDVKLMKIIQHLDALGEPSEAAKTPAQRRAAQFFSAGPSASNGAGVVAATPQEEKFRKNLRSQRFQEAATASREAGSGGAGRSEVSLQEARECGVAYGRSAALEKEYLRLTSMPTVDQVRPPHVLRAALRLVQEKWSEGGDYGHACEQLKAIRQDLTVQHMGSDLAVQVYESHARIALECEDTAEFLQCTTVLRRLYRSQPQHARNRGEMQAYCMLHAAVHSNANPALLVGELRGMEESLLHDECVQHALAVVRSVASGSSSRFFALYEGAPRMIPYLMDMLANRLRRRTLAACLCAHRPCVPLPWLGSTLGLEPDETQGFLASTGCVVKDGQLLTSASRQVGTAAR